MTATPVVQLQRVTRRYRSGSSIITALADVDLHCMAGEQLALVGPSGSGKSTLLGLLAGLDQPDSGRVVIAGHDLATLSPHALARFRGERLGFIFQAYRLLPTLTARENIAVPLELAGRRDALACADHWLNHVGLAARADHLPAQLSGGEQQRVALARALAPNPALLFADEPTGNLDRATGTAMTELLLASAAHLGATLVVVTHDHELAARLPRQVTLRDGRVVNDQAAHPAPVGKLL